MSKVLAGIGGAIAGLIIGIFIGAGPAMEVASAFPFPFLIGIFAVAFVGGLMLGRVKQKTVTTSIKLAGRVFDFPQWPVYASIALKRASTILPVRGTE